MSSLSGVAKDAVNNFREYLQIPSVHPDINYDLHIHCPGATGQGSLLLDNTAGEKVAFLLEKFFNFRKGEKQKLVDNPTLTLGDVTTVNLTQLRGGVQSNVVPPEFVIVINCRISPCVDIKKFEETINQWCKEAGNGIWIEYEQKNPLVASTKLDNTNLYWLAFKQATDQLGLKLIPQISPAASDSRYIRSLGLPAIGCSPISNTPVLMHDHDEYLGVATFIKGIEIYCKIISTIGNVDDKTE